MANFFAGIHWPHKARFFIITNQPYLLIIVDTGWNTQECGIVTGQYIPCVD